MYAEGTQTFHAVFDIAPGGGAVPEPSSRAMMLLGCGGMGAVLRRNRKRTALAA
jgi:hypothetical protein